MSSPRTIVYIDGLNLYYGSLKNTPYMWLNLEKLFKLIRNDDEIQLIYYFTSVPTQSGKSVRQLTYLRALNTLSLVRTTLGNFKNKTLTCYVADCKHKGSRDYKMPEEKATDVAIAVQILDDAYKDRMDNIVLVSGDTDLAPVLRKVRERFPEKKIIVYIPAPNKRDVRATAVDLRAQAHHTTVLPIVQIRASQFPKRLTGKDGYPIEKPSGWQ